MTKVKTITTLKFDYMQTGVGTNFENIKPLKSAYAEYDEAGHVILEISYSLNGQVEHKCMNKYNDQGKLIEELLYNEDGDLDEKKEYEYDANGNMIRELLYYMDGSFDTTTYDYDDNGKLIRKTTLDPDNELESKKTLTYENGRLIAEVTTDSAGNIMNELKIEYNENGNETAMERYNSEDDRTTRTEFVYDEKGSKSEAYTYVGEKLISKQLYESDEKDQLLKVIEEDQHSKSITTLAYDDNGNMIEQLEVNENGELNSRILRKFNENNKLAEVAVTIDRHGRGVNQNYRIQYLYEYY